MTKQEVRTLLGSILPIEPGVLDTPTSQEWRSLEARLGMQFPDAFVYFVELMTEFSFPGDIYNVTQAGRTNGNDTIEVVYANERQFSGWPNELIPFYGIGNGDYFALNRNEGAASGVYYWHHADRRVERYNDTFEAWLAGLADFLAGGKA